MDNLEDMDEDMMAADDSETMEEQPDGSVVISELSITEEPPPFDVNLATVLSAQKLTAIGEELCEMIDLDKDSRKKRDKQYAEGIQRTGLGDDAPGGAEFEGASRVVHPVMAEACVDYSSAAMKEIMPPDGPVKTSFAATATVTPDMIELAENKRDFYNWQLTKQMPEYRSSLEILLTQEPLGGSQYLKFWHDKSQRRPCCEFVPIDKVHLPYSATSFYTSPRVTVEVNLTRFEYDRRVRAGVYVDADAPTFLFPEQTDAERATNKIEGKQESAFNEDGTRTVYEVYAYHEVEGEDELPYFMTIDAHTHRVVGLYRNWEEQDPLRQKLDWMVDFTFIPWRGAYGIGLPHLIGGLSASATGALRALLDSAHIQNFPGALKLKGARQSGQNIPMAPTEIVDIDAPAAVDDIRKVVMPMPFPGPSSTLFQLLGFVVEAAKGVVSTSEEKIADASNQMPVGTTMALIEQGSKVFSQIFARQHRSQEKVLEILDRINRDNYDPEVQQKAFGRVLVPVEAFDGINNICPVSDPHIFSESQRFAQHQGVQQLVAGSPQLPWNQYAIARRALRLMHVDNINELLPEPPKPVSADPDQEIMAAMQGQQLAVQPQMNHLWHITTQLNFILDPVFGAANPAIVSPGFGVIMADAMSHWQYLRMSVRAQAQQQAATQYQMLMVQRAAELGAPPEAAGQMVAQGMQQPQAQMAIYQQADRIYGQQTQQFQQLAQRLQQADQLVKQKMAAATPQLPPDAQVQLQLGQAEIARKTELDKATIGLRQQERELDNRLKMFDVQSQERQQQFENMLAMQSQKLEEATAAMSQQTEMQKNSLDNQQHQMTELLKNHEDSQTNLMMEQMRQEGLQTREEMKKRYEAFQAQLDRLAEMTLAGKENGGG